MADVFVSYSRADQPFVRALHDTLARLNKDIWVDWEDIPPTAEWRKEVYGGIESSDTFLFVISPDAMRSGECRGDGEPAFRAEGTRRNGYGAAFSPDGAAIATSSADGTARIWDASSGRLSSELRGHANDVLSVAFTPDGARVLTASEDGTARIWDVTAGRQRAVLNQTNEGVRAAFSPGGQIVLTGSEDIYGAKVWDAGTGRLVSQLSRFTEIVSSVGFSPNGKWALTASHDASVRVWDPATGALAIDLRDHTGPVYAASFGPDSKLVVTAGDDGRALVFRCDACGSIDDLLAMASRLVTRSLTAEERLEYLPDGGGAAR